MKASEDIRKMAIEATKMDTKQFLKSELNKIDKNAFWEIDGYGNTDIIVRVMENYAQAKTFELEFALDYQKEKDLEERHCCDGKMCACGGLTIKEVYENALESSPAEEP